MQIVRVRVCNFRGIKKGEVHLDGHSVLVGDNNAGKSTLLEAIDLVLGPERLARRPVIDEHDFHAGFYVDVSAREVVPIQIEVVIAELTLEQQRHFRDHVEWWDSVSRTLLVGPPAEGTEKPEVAPVLRVFFNGWYDVEEDDFKGDTFYAIPELQEGGYPRFTTSDKRQCGFLLLRTLRTGARALSLERGSLLDIILRLQDKRLRLWEDVLSGLRDMPVGEREQIGTLLASVQEAIRHYVPSDWADNPHMRVSDLTREMLRRTLTVFMGTGANRPDGTPYAAPYQHQGTGTINTLVLALLSIIAELRQNVIFAMEEPEIAIPPYTQKRIIASLRKKSAQAIFTSHSPYVLEEFEPRQVRVLTRRDCQLTERAATYPPSVKAKNYRTEFRTRFCEALLAKHVLVVEGRTEFDAMPAAAARLWELEPELYKSLDNLGVAIVDAKGETNVAPLGAYFRDLGKFVFAVFDKQSAAGLDAIRKSVHHAFESQTKGFEDLVLNQTGEATLRNYALAVVASGDWPPHLASATPTAASTAPELRAALSQYFGWAKGGGNAGDLLATCNTAADMPQYVRETLRAIADIIEPPPAHTVPPAPAAPIVPPAPVAPPMPAIPAVPAVSPAPVAVPVPAIPAVPVVPPAPVTAPVPAIPAVPVVAAAPVVAPVSAIPAVPVVPPAPVVPHPPVVSAAVPAGASPPPPPPDAGGNSTVAPGESSFANFVPAPPKFES
jgi:putative ATP-dependent endonuclease of OLD family